MRQIYSWICTLKIEVFVLKYQNNRKHSNKRGNYEEIF